MSFMSQVNEDELYVRPEQASRGSTVGFIEGMQRSYEYGKLFDSQLGVAQAMIDAEYANRKRIQDAGGKAPESLYTKVAPEDDYNPTFTGRAYRVAKAVADGDFGLYAALAGANDAALKDLQKKYPAAGIRTYSEMFEDTRKNYEKMKLQNERNYSAGGNIGWAVGAMGAGVNPDVNPLNFWTLQMGGAGKTIAGRIASQGVAQGAVQAVAEVTGVRANKRLLGENPTVQDSLINVGAAALGGAGFQGVAEAGGAALRGLGRRWFRNVPNDPAPPIDGAEILKRDATPTAQTPARQVSLSADVEARLTKAVQDTAGTSRANLRGAQADYAHVAQGLESWTGPMPWEVAPPSHTRMPGQADIQTPDFRAPSPGETVDEIARRVDPELFKIYDKLAAERQTFRDMIAKATADAANSGEAIKREAFIAGRDKLQPLRDELTFVEQKIAKANRRKAKIYETRRQELLAQISEGEAALLGADPATIASYRNRVMAADEKMRDLAEPVSRAYARAQGKWNVYEGQRAEIEAMAMRGDSKVPDNFASLIDDAERAAADVPQKPSLFDAVPELSVHGLVRGENETALDVLARQAEAAEKEFDKQMEEAKAAAPKLLKAEGEEAVIDVAGIPRKLRLDDEIRILNEDGSTSVTSARKMLEDMQEDDEVLGAVTTCSVGKISASA